MTMLLALVLLASCSKKQGAMLVPDDAMFVMRFDMKKASEKSGLSGDKSELKDWLKKQVKSAGMDKKMRDKVLDIIDDPTKSGIDFTEPVFIYASATDMNDADVAFVASMASKGDMVDLLKTIDEVELEDADGGIKYCQLDPTAAIIFSDDWFFGGKVDDVDDMIETLKERVAGKGTLEGNKAFEQMCSKNSIAQFLFMGEGFENIFKNVPDGKEALYQMREILPENVELKDFAALADFDMNPGEMTLTSEAIALTKECEDYMQETYTWLKPIGDDLTKYISDKGLSLFINLDAKKYLDNISKMVSGSGIDDETLEMLKGIADNLDGTLALDLYGIEDSNPLVKFYLGTKNADLINLVMQQIGGDQESSEIEKTGENQYLIPTNYDYDWDSEDFTAVPTAWAAFGFENGQTYFSTDKDNIFTTPSEKYPTKEIKGKGIYLRFNADFFNQVADQANPSARMVCKALGGIFDCAEGYVSDKNVCVFRIAMKDKKKTPVEAISDIVMMFLN